MFSLVPRSQAWVRRRKINPRAQDAFQFRVVVKLRAVISGDGFYSLPFFPKQLNGPFQRQFLGGALNRSDPDQPGFSFHHRHQTRLDKAMTGGSVSVRNIIGV